MSIDSAKAAAGPGAVKTFVTPDGNHPPEVWAEIAVEALMPRLLDVAAETPEPLRSHALALEASFRTLIQAQVARTVAEALRVERCRAVLPN